VSEMKLGDYIHRKHKRWRQIVTNIEGDTVTYKCEFGYGCTGHKASVEEFNKMFRKAKKGE
jgi:hypothetical protein